MNQDELKTEWIILADFAEVLNGKLYTMGGGWETLTVNALPVPQNIAVAVSFLVPWNETNQRHEFLIEIVDQDGKRMVGVNGEMEVGRPPGIPLGLTQRTMLAVNITATFEQLGTYVVSTSIHGQASSELKFRVIAGPQLQAQQVTGPLKERP